MAEATIPVDLRNPGQVFACLGLMEAAEILCGPAEGGCVWTGRETRARFRLSVDGPDDPVLAALRFLSRAEVRALAPAGSGLAAKEPGVATLPVEGGVFPCPRPDTPSALPALLVDADGAAIPLGHWADVPASGRDNLKFWAGAGGYSGAALTRDALDLVRLGGNALADAARDPFALSAPQSSSFRFDWRRDYTALDVGFSPNEHGAIRMVGYPLVELLAAIGLQHARPQRLEKLHYRYAVSSARLPTLLARAVLGGQTMGFPARLFSMRLGWPGQEGQARCILDAQEESSP
ncbi:type I-G CRISPR-associated protein Cas8g2 [Azospirillum soli]|uniref:type I-G CRISPR-associated protein Cas8g2 n=1 Tax=Azospirillum soli TaxID=1304799 RepID=UPI001AEBA324|nr:type I-U CRISPR-associated protein Cas8c [Azospirillum soli]MBP2310744.1 CRISPR-associated protein Csx14 [Azospirillum soli]